MYREHECEERTLHQYTGVDLRSLTHSTGPSYRSFSSRDTPDRPGRQDGRNRTDTLHKEVRSEETTLTLKSPTDVPNLLYSIGLQTMYESSVG